MREQKALRVALSTILSISMVAGSVPTIAVAEVLDEDAPQVVEVVEEAAPVDEPAASVVDRDEHLRLTTEVTPMTVTVAKDNIEDDLLSRYVEQLFDKALPDNEDEPLVTAQMVALTGVNAKVFDLLSPMISEVANGTRQSSVFEIPLDQVTDKLTFTAEELGVDSLVVDGGINEAAEAAAYATVEPDADQLIGYLVATHPYELYWFDKTEGLSIGGYGCGVDWSGEQYVLTLTGSLRLTFAVAPDYSAGANVVDASEAARAQQAIATAQRFATEESSSSPYDRLKLFNDTICSMVSYNDEAAAGGVVFGDPWQLVYVFDGDDDTNVVCEGYSKAFKYLCDLANIPDVTCSTMSGTMSGGTGAGNHMWNVVNMDDGRNYLVDVTNCDQGAVGHPYQLFIVPFSSGSVSDGYVFNTESKPITYEYGADMSQLYTNDELAIAATAYDPNQHSADMTEAQAVDEAIAKLSPVDELTMDGAYDVAAVRAAYNTLTDTQKDLVENLETLVAAEARIADLTAAHAVDELIANLPAVDDLTLDHADAVAAARSSFDELNDVRKQLVQGVSALAEAEARIEELQAAAEQHAADLAKAKVVDDEIAGLPKVDELTLDYADAVAKARAAYDALSEAQKALVASLDTLEAAETRIAELRQQAADAAAAQTVDTKIAALPAAAELTLDDQAQVASVRAAYEGLSEAQKALVTDLASLEAAEAKIDELQQAADQQVIDEAAARGVDARIATLPQVDELTLEDADVIADARSLYNVLTDTQKELVQKLDVLETAEQRIAELRQQAADEAAAQKVDAKIAELPQVEELTLDNAAAVETVRAAYNALTESQKALVLNLNTLEAVETKIAVLKQQAADVAAAQAVDETIAKLPNVDDLTLDNVDAVNEACAAYEALTDDQKLLVKNLATLEAAEQRIAGLYIPLTGAVVEVAKAVYNGAIQTPQVKVTLNDTRLTKDTDFTVAAGSCINAGEHIVTITGVGKYKGTAEATFTITPKSISAATVSAIAAQPWSGRPITPEPAVKDGAKALVKNTDYTLSYANNTNLGNATVTVTGKGNYSGTKTATFSITKAISGVTVSSIATQKWTGKAITPAPTVKDGTTTLRNGTDYTLSYKNNVNPGTATVTIMGKGFYTGTKNVTFKVGAKTGAWKRSGSRWWYQYTDGTYPKSQFADIDGARYYFDASGYMVTGWKKVGASWYFFRSDGKMGANDWVKSGSKWCYLRANGIMATGWVEVSGKRYWMDGSGYMATGWRLISGKWYYFESSGAMARSKWVKSGSKWCYLRADGTMVTGWVEVSGKWYWMDASGYMATGWRQISGKWYYFESSGAMAKSKWVGNYYLQQNGVMATNTWIGKYHVNASGKWDATR